MHLKSSIVSCPVLGLILWTFLNNRSLSVLLSLWRVGDGLGLGLGFGFALLLLRLGLELLVELLELLDVCEVLDLLVLLEELELLDREGLCLCVLTGALWMDSTCALRRSINSWEKSDALFRIFTIPYTISIKIRML